MGETEQSVFTPSWVELEALIIYFKEIHEYQVYLAFVYVTYVLFYITCLIHYSMIIIIIGIIIKILGIYVLAYKKFACIPYHFDSFQQLLTVLLGKEIYFREFVSSRSSPT